MASKNSRFTQLNSEFVPFDKRETEQSISDRFLQQVRKHPGRPAIDSTAETLTYLELDHRSNNIANALLERGYASGGSKPIALLLGHSSSMVVAMLGVLKTGQIYVPLDPSYPASRLNRIIENAQAAAVLTDDVHEKVALNIPNRAAAIVNIDRISQEANINKPDVYVHPDQIAYVFYTSGSTGTPKGVIQTHRNVLCNIRNYTNDICIGPEDRLSLITPFSFAASVSDLFGGLMNGATVCLFDLRQSGIQSCIQWLEREKITVYYSVPSVFRLLASTLDETVNLSCIRVVKLGGDSITYADYQAYRDWFCDKCILFIVLGSTEINLISRYFVDKETGVPRGVTPVGYPPDDVELLLLDEDDKPVPNGDVGNLVVRGAHVALGYWNESADKQSRIVPDTENPNLRLFKTGDLGRILPDGSLVHLGRSDSQLKISGQSVSLKEVEAALAGVPGVREAAVVARTDDDGGKKLIGYIASESEFRPSVKQLREFLKQKLPQYMVPAQFEFLDRFDYTPSGKLDRKKLSGQIPNRDHPAVQKSNVTEDQLNRIILIWKDVLNLGRIGPQDDFFELGGDSLSAFRALVRVKREFDVEVSLNVFFDDPTPAGLYSAISKLLIVSTPD